MIRDYRAFLPQCQPKDSPAYRRWYARRLATSGRPRNLAPRTCGEPTCRATFTPKVGNQKRCAACCAADPYNTRNRPRRGAV